MPFNLSMASMSANADYRSAFTRYKNIRNEPKPPYILFPNRTLKQTNLITVTLLTTVGVFCYLLSYYYESKAEQSVLQRLNSEQKLSVSTHTSITPEDKSNDEKNKKNGKHIFNSIKQIKSDYFLEETQRQINHSRKASLGRISNTARRELLGLPKHVPMLLKPIDPMENSTPSDYPDL